MRSNKLFFTYLCLAVSFFLPFNTAIGQPSQTIFDVISREEPAKITLEADFTTLLANKKTDDSFPGMLTLSSGKSYVIKLKPKGKYRRKTAEIPPLRVKFPQKTLVSEGLDTLNEVRLVFPCYDNNLGDELIIREYLAYRMFEMLSPASVRARLVKITVRDTHVEKSRKTMFALLLEDNEETASRLKGVEVEQYGMPMDSMHQNQAALVTMFEYMIGNTDWDISMMRNIRLIRSNESGRIILVPYDFDFSGFVSAPYASPSSDSGLLTVRDRYLMTQGINRESLRRATNLLRSSKEKLYDICRSKYISKDSATELILYLETFFTQIDANGDVPGKMRVPLSE